MDENLQSVRRDIENTRVALGDKIGRLENKIETAKKTTFNPAYHVRKRPWPTLGVFVAAGWVIGRSLGSGRNSRSKAAANGARREHRIVGSMASSAGSAFASMLGTLAGDMVRDFVRKRKDGPT